MRLFSSLKSDINWTERSFLGIKNVGAAHLDLFIFLSTPTWHNRSTSCLNVCSYACGIPYGRAWCGFAPSRSSILYGDPFQRPNVPSNSWFVCSITYITVVFDCWLGATNYRLFLLDLQAHI